MSRNPLPQREKAFLFALLWLSVGAMLASAVILRAPQAAVATLFDIRQNEAVERFGAAALSPREMETLLSRKTGTAFDRALLEMYEAELASMIRFAELASSRSADARVRAESARLTKEAEADLLRLRSLPLSP
jgi:hypothetical protein